MARAPSRPMAPKGNGTALKKPFGKMKNHQLLLDSVSNSAPSFTGERQQKGATSMIKLYFHASNVQVLIIWISLFHIWIFIVSFVCRLFDRRVCIIASISALLKTLRGRASANHKLVISTQHGPYFASAIWAANPLAEDFGVNTEPPY